MPITRVSGFMNTYTAAKQKSQPIKFAGKESETGQLSEKGDVFSSKATKGNASTKQSSVSPQRSATEQGRLEERVFELTEDLADARGREDWITAGDLQDDLDDAKDARIEALLRERKKQR